MLPSFFKVFHLLESALMVSNQAIKRYWFTTESIDYFMAVCMTSNLQLEYSGVVYQVYGKNLDPIQPLSHYGLEI